MHKSKHTACVFVYGTLRKAVGHAMHRILARDARFVGPATVRGALYDLGAYPGLVTGGDAARLVHGEVYALDPDSADATLADLDAYEGCAATDPEPHEYRRVVVQVTLADGALLAASTYVLNRPHAGLQPIPDGDYLAWRRRARDGG
jgi:gamma-glutamylcyclotransferase (GGCT)/AIG2-like uncharacterized protein YtfP